MKTKIEILIGLLLLVAMVFITRQIQQGQSRMEEKINLSIYNDKKIMDKLNGDFIIKCD